MAHMRRTPQEAWRLDATKFVVLVILLLLFLSQIIYGCGGPTTDGTVIDETAADETDISHSTSADESDAIPILLAPAADSAIEPGEVTFEGTGLPDTQLQLMLDDEPLGQTEVHSDGIWSYTTRLDAGLYDLRLHTLDDDSHVISQSEPLTLDVGGMATAAQESSNASGDEGTSQASEDNLTEENGDDGSTAEDAELPIEPEVKIVDTPQPTVAPTPIPTSAPLTLDISGFDDASGPGLRTSKGTGPANRVVEILVDNEVKKSTTISQAS